MPANPTFCDCGAVLGEGHYCRKPLPPDPMLARIREMEGELAEERRRADDAESEVSDLNKLVEQVSAEKAAHIAREVRESRRVEEARGERDAARSERDEAKAAFLRCAEAIGVAYEADGHASQPGPIDVVERYIREAVRNADAHIEMVERIAVAAGRVGVADAHDVREGLAWEAIETLANRAAEFSTIRAALGPLVAKMRAAWAEERRLCEVVQTGAGLDLGDPADMNTACCAYERALSAEVAAEADAIAALTELFPED